LFAGRDTASSSFAGPADDAFAFLVFQAWGSNWGEKPWKPEARLPPSAVPQPAAFAQQLAEVLKQLCGTLVPPSALGPAIPVLAPAPRLEFYGQLAPVLVPPAAPAPAPVVLVPADTQQGRM
jgi:hypothetical protein